MSGGDLQARRGPVSSSGSQRVVCASGGKGLQHGQSQQLSCRIEE